MKIIILSIILCSCLNSGAQNSKIVSLDSLFSHIENHNRGMGSIDIQKGSTKLYSRDYGQKFQSNSSDLVYRIASITKIYTAVIIMQLIEEGKLSLESKLVEYFPSIVNSDKITIEHMLSHSSGIDNYLNNYSYAKEEWMYHNLAEDSLKQIIMSQNSIFTPGDTNIYSNSNYVLLGWVAEDITNKTLGELITKRIIQPLKLNNTYYLACPENRKISSYEFVNTWQEKRNTNLAAALGAGGILSSTSDMNVFIRALFDMELLNSKSLNRMTTTNNRYGLGIFEYEIEGRLAYGHSGGVDGFQGVSLYFIEDSTCISILSNGVVMPIFELVNGVLKLLYEKDYQFPEFNDGINLSANVMELYVGTYQNEAYGVKMEIFISDNDLYGRVQGQSKFPLTPLGHNTFSYEPGSIQIVFEGKYLKLNQAGNEVNFSKLE